MNHASLYRSWHIVEKVVELCEQKCPHGVILEIIEDLKAAPCQSDIQSNPNSLEFFGRKGNVFTAKESPVA